MSELSEAEIYHKLCDLIDQVPMRSFIHQLGYEFPNIQEQAWDHLSRFAAAFTVGFFNQPISMFQNDMIYRIKLLKALDRAIGLEK